MGSYGRFVLWNQWLGDSPLYFGRPDFGFLSLALAFPQQCRFEKSGIFRLHSALLCHPVFVYCLGIFLWKELSALFCIVRCRSRCSFCILLAGQALTFISEGRTRLFATKKSLSGCGCNFQRFCHRAIFVGIDYEFHDFIQAVHRIYRFLQEEEVIIDIIYTEAEVWLSAYMDRVIYNN